VPYFIGRQDVLKALHSAHFDHPQLRSDGPIISVLAGLGGSGKTQISLKFALDYEERYTFPIIRPACAYISKISRIISLLC
jgi:hypothetical protein